jgi:hypothetical protein
MPGDKNNKEASVSTEKKVIPWHPLLFALYSPLRLYAFNMSTVPFTDVIPYLFWPCLLTLVFMFLSRPIYKNLSKTALAASVGVSIMFSFDSFVAFSKWLAGYGVHVFGYNDPINGALVLLFSVFFTVLIGISVLKSPHKKVTQFLNVLSLLLMGFTSLTLIKGSVSFTSYLAEVPIALPPVEDLTVEKPLPDIYYLILDGHARWDTVTRLFDLDGRDFTDALQSQGFYVLEDSYANYGSTTLSLASSLNMSYLQDMLSESFLEASRGAPLHAILEDNIVQRFLKELGYERITFTSTSIHKNSLADKYYAAGDIPGAYGRAFDVKVPPLIIPSAWQRESHRNLIKYVFDTLPQVATLEEPTFTYAHILMPHPPFVVDSEGNPSKIGDPAADWDGDHYRGTPEDYWQGYREQLQYVDTTVLKMVEDILRESGGNSIIVLQADHGSGRGLFWEDSKKTDLEERMGILNAIYFPDGDYSMLTPSLSPVNTFRVIFDKYFGTSLGLLEDRVYFSTYTKPFMFHDVTDELGQVR